MSGFVWSTPPIEYARALDVRLRRREHLLQRLRRRPERGAEVPELRREALGERAEVAAAAAAAAALAEAAAAAGSAAARSAATAGRSAALLGADLREARLDLRQLRRRRRRRRSRDGLLLPARLERRHDLRHRALLVLGEQQQAARHLRHAGERGDPRRLRLRERQLRAGQEEVVDEVLARLAELRQVGEHGLVRLDHGARVAAAAAGAAAGEAALLLLRRERDRQVGADARQRVQRGLLRLVEPARQRHDRDHEADADCEAEHGEDRPRLAARQLVAQVREVEQRLPIQPPPGEDGLRPALLAGFPRCAVASPGSSPCR